MLSPSGFMPCSSGPLKLLLSDSERKSTGELPVYLFQRKAKISDVPGFAFAFYLVD
jgi:hypothetical protein